MFGEYMCNILDVFLSLFFIDVQRFKIKVKIPNGTQRTPFS